jgi:hypothetical protein
VTYVTFKNTKSSNGVLMQHASATTFSNNPGTTKELTNQPHSLDLPQSETDLLILEALT